MSAMPVEDDQVEEKDLQKTAQDDGSGNVSAKFRGEREVAR